MLAAVLGGGALVTLGGLGVATHDAAPALAKSSKMNVGATSTETTPPATPVTSMAKPPIKGPAPLPTEEAAAE
jgi:hypothetical protein